MLFYKVINPICQVKESIAEKYFQTNDRIFYPASMDVSLISLFNMSHRMSPSDRHLLSEISPSVPNKTLIYNLILNTKKLQLSFSNKKYPVRNSET